MAWMRRRVKNAGKPRRRWLAVVAADDQAPSGGEKKPNSCRQRQPIDNAPEGAFRFGNDGKLADKKN